MSYRRILFLIFNIVAFSYFPVSGQSSNSYSNNWIDYSKPYVKILVKEKGIHRLPLSTLPSSFPINNLDKLQLWHKGKQVAISSINNTEILFYAVPNTGESDSLLYRPMSSRLNPYFSIYSDNGAYFLTISDSKSLRSEIVNQTIDEKVAKLSYHIQKDVITYKSEYSLSTANPLRPDFFNSFFEKGASKTGTIILRNTLVTFPIQLSNAASTSVKSKIKLLIHGRSNNSRNVEVYVGKTEQTLRLVKAISNSGFDGSDLEFELLENDLNESKNGLLALKSTNLDEYERFSLSYYSIEYSQQFIAKSKSYEFTLPAQSALVNRVSISGAESNAVVYDITDTTKIISGKASDFMITRKSSKPLKLLITSETIAIPATQVSMVNFQQFDPKNSNYIIVTSDNLLSASKTYATYRSSDAGGKYKTVIASINDLYNQFNYGEPSPVGIRNFVNYMLSDQNKDKYLFLMGKSISYMERMVREMPDEVPTIGFPGSDILLVEGLAGGKKDVPTIPVGRFPALTNDNILDYLQKVKDYEHTPAEELGWRKKILHLNGGKTADEITQLKNVLEALKPTVESGVVGGKVIQFVKQQGIGEVEKVNITPEVNDGVGMITYFGHGSPTVTDLDMGYISDAARGYNNSNRYPFMFFNGCDVGNIFSARFNTNPNASDRMALSMDWMLAPKRGAIAIIANSFAGYVGPLTNYINSIYKGVFADSSLTNLPVGKMQLKVADKIVSSGANYYDIANIHQSLLQGDPALKLISVSRPDYAVDINDGIKLYSESANKTIENSTTIRTAVVLSNWGQFKKDQKVPISIDYEYKDGSKDKKIETFSAIPYQDTLFFSIPNKKNILRIVVNIDPDSTIVELSKKNNISELNIDWERAKNQSLYPIGSNKDVVPPILRVKFNNRTVKNYENLSPNPVINIGVEDDRIISADTSLLDVFIKSCWDDLCSYKQLTYSKDQFKIDLLESHSFQISFFPSDLINGKYELLVNAHDQSGNSISQPYNVRFEISDLSSPEFTVTCSPNPTTSYIRLHTKINDYAVNQSLRYIIYNLDGIIIEDSGVININSEEQEWYWYPKSAPSGLYIYKVIKMGNDVSSKQVTGKVIFSK